LRAEQEIPSRWRELRRAEHADRGDSYDTVLCNDRRGRRGRARSCRLHGGRRGLARAGLPLQNHAAVDGACRGLDRRDTQSRRGTRTPISPETPRRASSSERLNDGCPRPLAPSLPPRFSAKDIFTWSASAHRKMTVRVSLPARFTPGGQTRRTRSRPPFSQLRLSIWRSAHPILSSASVFIAISRAENSGAHADWMFSTSLGTIGPLKPRPFVPTNLAAGAPPARDDVA
jgi:hypothetical protein